MSAELGVLRRRRHRRRRRPLQPLHVGARSRPTRRQHRRGLQRGNASYGRNDWRRADGRRRGGRARASGSPAHRAGERGPAAATPCALPAAAGGIGMDLEIITVGPKSERRWTLARAVAEAFTREGRSREPVSPGAGGRGARGTGTRRPRCSRTSTSSAQVPPFVPGPAHHGRVARPPRRSSGTRRSGATWWRTRRGADRAAPPGVDRRRFEMLRIPSARSSRPPDRIP